METAGTNRKDQTMVIDRLQRRKEEITVIEFDKKGAAVTM